MFIENEKILITLIIFCSIISFRYYLNEAFTNNQ